MRHPHPIEQVCMDSTTASGIANDTIKQKRSCATNTRYFWIRDQKTLIFFLIARKVGQENLADYFTKHNYVKLHKRVCSIYLQTYKIPRTVPLILLKPSLKGCVDTEDPNMEEFCKTLPINLI